jgi:hypothetical protein
VFKDNGLARLSCDISSVEWRKDRMRCNSSELALLVVYTVATLTQVLPVHCKGLVVLFAVVAVS